MASTRAPPRAVADLVKTSWVCCLRRKAAARGQPARHRVPPPHRRRTPGNKLARGDDGEYLVAVALELGRSDSRDAGEVGPVPRFSCCDVAERPVVEHDVGGDAVSLRPLATPLLEPVE